MLPKPRQQDRLNFDGIDPDFSTSVKQESHSAHHGPWYTKSRLFTCIGPSNLPNNPQDYALIELVAQLLVSPLEASSPLSFVVVDVGIHGKGLSCRFWPTSTVQQERVMQLQSGHLVRCVGVYKQEQDWFHCFKVERIDSKGLAHLQKLVEAEEQEVPDESDGWSG